MLDRKTSSPHAVQPGCTVISEARRESVPHVSSSLQVMSQLVPFSALMCSRGFALPRKLVIPDGLK